MSQTETETQTTETEAAENHDHLSSILGYHQTTMSQFALTSLAAAFTKVITDEDPNDRITLGTLAEMVQREPSLKGLALSDLLCKMVDQSVAAKEAPQADEEEETEVDAAPTPAKGKGKGKKTEATSAVSATPAPAAPAKGKGKKAEVPAPTPAAPAKGKGKKAAAAEEEEETESEASGEGSKRRSPEELEKFYAKIDQYGKAAGAAGISIGDLTDKFNVGNKLSKDDQDKIKTAIRNRLIDLRKPNINTVYTVGERHSLRYIWR